ncbi:MAG: MBL fold metallo-hydrolase, partial [Porticoccaceae bacterium]|nr:MBL fold metallo-hydrolase [Porticoccaceae bacterium]
MKIHQLYTHSVLRNFTYLIELSDGTAICIDPWHADLVNSALLKRNLRLSTIINTHEHWDHTQG